MGMAPNDRTPVKHHILSMVWAWHQMIEPMLNTTFCPWYGHGTRSYYPCWAQCAWHSVYGLSTNEDCRGSHRLQLKNSCRELDLSVAQPELGAYIQTKLKSAVKLAQLCRAVKTNCRVCNNRSIHVMVKTQNLKSIFDNHVIVCALASITFFSDCES